LGSPEEKTDCPTTKAALALSDDGTEEKMRTRLLPVSVM
jgi:hypothetical protein